MGDNELKEGGPKSATQPADQPSVSQPAAPPEADYERDRHLLDFLKILRLTFKMASIYQQDHPTFKRTIDELMASLNTIFAYFSPLEIGFSPNSLLIGEKFWGGDKTTTELARLSHFRKIKKRYFVLGSAGLLALHFTERGAAGSKQGLTLLVEDEFSSIWAEWSGLSTYEKSLFSLRAAGKKTSHQSQVSGVYWQIKILMEELNGS